MNPLAAADASRTAEHELEVSTRLTGKWEPYAHCAMHSGACRLSLALEAADLYHRAQLRVMHHRIASCESAMRDRISLEKVQSAWEMDERVCKPVAVRV